MNVLSEIMGVNDAAKRWGLSPGYVKNLCAAGKVRALKIDNRWVLEKNQPNPSVKALNGIKTQN